MIAKNWTRWMTLLVISTLTISGCSLIPKQVEVQTKFIERKIPIQDQPKGLTLYPVTFYAVTEDNYKEFEEKFKDKNENLVFFALSVPDYENMSLNLAEMKRYIDQQKTIIVYYEKSINNEYKAQIGVEEGNE